MKKDNLIILVAAGIGLYVMSKMANGTPIFGGSAATAPTVNGAARSAAITPAAGNNIFSPGYGVTNGVGMTLNAEGAGFQVANVYDPLGYIGTTK